MIFITDSNTPNINVYYPREKIWGNYGESQLIVEHPIAEIEESPWLEGLQNNFTLPFEISL